MANKAQITFVEDHHDEHTKFYESFPLRSTKPTNNFPKKDIKEYFKHSLIFSAEMYATHTDNEQRTTKQLLLLILIKLLGFFRVSNW